MIEVRIGEKESKEILEILNGRELTADYLGFTDEEAIRIEELISGSTRTQAKIFVGFARKKAKKYTKQK